MRWPLRNQFLLPVLVVSVLSVALVGGANAWLAYTHTRDSFAERLQGVADVLSNSSFPLTPVVLRQMRDLTGAEFVLTLANGAPRATSLPEAPAALPVDRLVASPGEITLSRTLTIDRREYLHAALQMSSRSRGELRDRLHVLFPLVDYRRALWAAVAPPLVVGGLSLGAVVVAANVVAKRIGRTTQRLGAEVQRLAEGDYQQLAPPRRNDELRDLCDSLNLTAQRLEVYESQVRQAERSHTLAKLAAGLAHEMRNASTGCRMAIDLHGESCPLRHDESLGVARRQLQIIEGQLQRYLRLGVAEHNPDRQRVNADALVASAVAQATPAAEHAAAHLEWSPGAAGRELEVNHEAITQLVVNLLQNAVEAVAAGRAAGGPPGRIRVASTASDHDWRLTVSDNGPGPDPRLADRLFTPFTSSKPEGVGLGLALSQQAAAEHGGRVDWRREHGHTCFSLTLPFAT